MPEITFCLFDLGYLFKLFPINTEDLQDSITDFEVETFAQMAENRTKLFGNYNYNGEF